MAGKAVAVVDDEEALEPEEIAQDDPEEGGEGQGQPENPETDDEIVISIGDEEIEPAEESSTIKTMRQRLNEALRENTELKRGSAPKPIEVGEKPTLAGCEYDEDKFEADLDAWKERERAAKAQQTDTQRAGEAAQQAWEKDRQAYHASKARLTVPDLDEAENVVTAALSPVQQAVLVKAADDGAKVMYALGKHPARLAELAEIDDPIKFAKAIVKLEGTIKMAPRRSAPAVDEPQHGNAQLISADKKLAALEKEADRTGDRTKLVAYKRALKAKK